MKNIVLAFVFCLALTGCKFLQAAMDAANAQMGLTDQEITQGLKEALKVGLNTSVSTASKQDGYLKNEVIKLLLPPEVQQLQDKINTGSVKMLNGAINVPYTKILDAYVKLNPNLKSDPFDELLVAMNRGAESAAKKATPIFKDALLSMTVNDALGILQGGQTSATEYFNRKTKAQLIAAFQPEVKNALEQTKALDIYESTADFVNFEYKVDYMISSYTLKMSDYLGMTLPESIDGYATEKAVDGLFYLIGEEEKKIRANPYSYASTIIQKVFGSDEAKGA